MTVSKLTVTFNRKNYLARQLALSIHTISPLAQSSNVTSIHKRTASELTPANQYFHFHESHGDSKIVVAANDPHLVRLSDAAKHSIVFVNCFELLMQKLFTILLLFSPTHTFISLSIWHEDESFISDAIFVPLEIPKDDQFSSGSGPAVSSSLGLSYTD